jgi:transmembrane sensor
MNQNIWEIGVKKFSGEQLSPEEAVVLEQWLSKEENQKVYQDMKADFERIDLGIKLNQYNSEQAWKKIDRHLRKGKILSLGKSIPWLAAAAALILVISIYSLIPLFRTNTIPMVEAATHSSDYSCPVVVLPDGSKVTLNHSSSLRYPELFPDTLRTISLIGEAFFEVSPNPGAPFIIKTNGVEVKVLGTSFSVSSFEGAETTEVMVQSGSVQMAGIDVLSRMGSKSIVLFPGEKGIYHAENKALVKEKGFDLNRLAWYTHTMEFDSEPLSKVLVLLGQTFNLQFDISPEVESSQTLTATFEHQELAYILDVIAITLELKIEKTGDNRYHIGNQ